MFKNKKFWVYDYCQSFDLKQENIDNYKQKGKIFEDFLYFYDMIGTGIHPSIKPYARELTDSNIISFISTCVDINTLKVLFAVLPNTKIVTLKFSMNDFDINNLEFLFNSLISKPNNIYNFIYEWNNKIKIDGCIYDLAEKIEQSNESLLSDILKCQQLLSKLVISSKLEALCLRGNYLGDDAVSNLFDNLKQNQFLRVLNLYKNNLTSKCITEFTSMLETNKKLEELNLGANMLLNIDLSNIKKSLGKIPMTHEQIEIYNKKIKDRDTIIEKNKKLKTQKKPEEPIPVIEEVTIIGDVYYTNKNTTLRNLNLMQNSFTTQCSDDVIELLDNNNDILLIMDSRTFSKDKKDKLLNPSGKYVSRIYLTK